MPPDALSLSLNRLITSPASLVWFLLSQWGRETESMVNGLYTASRGMTNILAKQDIHAQNMANTSTNGFKMARLVNKSEVTIGRNEDGELKQKEMQNMSEVFPSFTQGPMIRTANTFDLALSSNGF